MTKFGAILNRELDEVGDTVMFQPVTCNLLPVTCVSCSAGEFVNNVQQTLTVVLELLLVLFVLLVKFLLLDLL